MFVCLSPVHCLQIASREHLNQLAKGCSLGHMLHFDDADKDGRLNLNEFYTAFSKLYSKLLHLHSKLLRAVVDSKRTAFVDAQTFLGLFIK